LLKAPPGRVSAERNSLAQKYPFYTDFDYVGLKHFVQFQDGSELEVVLRYLDISKMLTLLSIEDKSYDIYPFSDRDEEVLCRVIDTKKNPALRQHIDNAMGRFYAYQQDYEKLRHNFEDRDYSVIYIPHFAETRYGITVKADGQYGIYSMFFGGDKTFPNYYAADDCFDEKHSLWLRLTWGSLDRFLHFHLHIDWTGAGRRMPEWPGGDRPGRKLISSSFSSLALGQHSTPLLHFEFATSRLNISTRESRYLILRARPRPVGAAFSNLWTIMPPMRTTS
jgi:hypothetical protein